MRHITIALKSGRVATLLALGLAGLYVATEFGVHPSQQAGASIPAKEMTAAIPQASDPLKLASLNIPRPLVRPDGLPQIEQPYQIDVVSLTEKWSALSFDIDQIRSGSEVPRFFVDHIPVDILDIQQVQTRKKIFLSVALPLILKANEEITARRTRLLKIIKNRKPGSILPADDQNWINQLTELYGAKPNDATDLLARIDVIPVSLALAQSIEESGWGTSRFAREGNALFGQRAWSPGTGIVPQERDDGKTYEVRVYDALIQSIKGYVHNLNSHPAYSEFRDQRAKLQQEDIPARGYELSRTLLSYSERGEAYVEALQSLIRVNSLEQFENARLIPERVAQNFTVSNN